MALVQPRLQGIDRQSSLTSGPEKASGEQDDGLGLAVLYHRVVCWGLGAGGCWGSVLNPKMISMALMRKVVAQLLQFCSLHHYDKGGGLRESTQVTADSDAIHGFAHANKSWLSQLQAPLPKQV